MMKIVPVSLGDISAEDEDMALMASRVVLTGEEDRTGVSDQQFKRRIYPGEYQTAPLRREVQS
jgi:hypothetical protein